MSYQKTRTVVSAKLHRYTSSKNRCTSAEGRCSLRFFLEIAAHALDIVSDIGLEVV